MPYPTETKHYSSTYPNAPQVIADPGGYVGFLDALLVTGYGIAALGDIVVTEGVAVVNVPSGHSLRKWMVAAHTGAGHAGLNGEHRVIAASGNTYTIEVTGVPNGTYSGGSTRVAPLGFEISYQSGHKRIYRSKDSRRNAVSLFVDDSNAVAGWNPGTNKALTQVRMVCDVVDIGSFTALDTTWWFKSYATSGTVARPWLLAGDALGFYSAVDVLGTGLAIASNHFVQLNTLAAGDQYATLLEGSTANASALPGYANALGYCGAGLNWMTMGTRKMARGLAQSGSAVDARYIGLGTLQSTTDGWLVSGARPVLTAPGSGSGSMTRLAEVSPADSGAVLSPLIACTQIGTSAEWGARARVPGKLSAPAVSVWSMNPALMPSPGGLPQSQLLALPAFTGGNTNNNSSALEAGFVGGYYVDVVGAWR